MGADATCPPKCAWVGALECFCIHARKSVHVVLHLSVNSPIPSIGANPTKQV